MLTLPGWAGHLHKDRELEIRGESGDSLINSGLSHSYDMALCEPFGKQRSRIKLAA